MKNIPHPPKAIDTDTIMPYNETMKRTIIDKDKLDAAMRGKFRSRRQLAQAAGITEVTLTNVRLGKPFTSATLDALANALGVSSLSLLSEVETVDIPLRTKASLMAVVPMTV